MAWISAARGNTGSHLRSRSHCAPDCCSAVAPFEQTGGTAPRSACPGTHAWREGVSSPASSFQSHPGILGVRFPLPGVGGHRLGWLSPQARGFEFSPGPSAGGRVSVPRPRTGGGLVRSRWLVRGVTCWRVDCTFSRASTPTSPNRPSPLSDRLLIPGATSVHKKSPWIFQREGPFPFRTYRVGNGNGTTAVSARGDGPKGIAGAVRIGRGCGGERCAPCLVRPSAGRH